MTTKLLCWKHVKHNLYVFAIQFQIVMLVTNDKFHIEFMFYH
jgi:hypothetical protein